MSKLTQEEIDEINANVKKVTIVLLLIFIALMIAFETYKINN